MHVDVIFGFGDHFVEKNVGKNIRDRTTLPAWRNLVEILAVDRRYEALSAREHVHVDDRNGDQSPAENLGREFARQPHQRVDGRIFRRMHAGRKAEHGSITASIDDHDGELNRARSRFPELQKAFRLLPLLGSKLPDPKRALRAQSASPCLKPLPVIAARKCGRYDGAGPRSHPALRPKPQSATSPQR